MIQNKVSKKRWVRFAVEDIKLKYDMHFIDGKRYYEFDMRTDLPLLEETAPYMFQYKNITIYSTSWKKMTLKILSAIDTLKPKTDDELLSIHYHWTKTQVFSRTKRTNYTPFRNLYLNTNHSSTHAMMNIQGLLKEYDIPLGECYFLIRRHFVAEPKEVRNIIREKQLDSL